MKIVLCVIIVVSSGMVGIIYADKFRKNYLFFADLVYIFDIFKVKIAFFQNNFANVIEESLPNTKSKTKFFESIMSLAKSSLLTEKNIIDCFDINIQEEEKQLIARYFVGVSKSYETKELLDYINGGKDYFLERYNYYMSKDKTDGSLVKKISISIGLVISILLY